MISRVGNVLYWVAVVIALLWGNGGFFAFYEPDYPAAVSIIGMVAIFLFGLAIKYTSEALGRLWAR